MLQLKKFPDIPVSTREEARESRPNPEEPRFRILAREEGSFPFVSGKISRRSRRISRGGALHRKGERSSRVVPPFPESPRCLSPFQGKLFSLHSLDFMPRIDSHHGGTWDSPVGKTPGKPGIPLSTRRDTSHSCYSSGGKRTCIPPSRRGLTLLGRLQKYPKIHVSTGEESSGSGTDSTQGLRPRHRRERNPERPPSNSHGDWTFLRPPERVPEIHVVSREHLPQLEKIQEVLPSRRDEAHFP